MLIGYEDSRADEIRTLPLIFNPVMMMMMGMEKVWTHRYCWGNNEKRKGLKGKLCRIIIAAQKRKVMVEFKDGGTEIVDVRALRRVPTEKEGDHGACSDQSEM